MINEKPWYIFDEVEQKRNFQTRVVRRSQHEHQEEKINPRLLRTTDLRHTKERKIE